MSALSALSVLSVLSVLSALSAYPPAYPPARLPALYPSGSSTRTFSPMPGSSDKSRGIALILAMVLGIFGAHRFYVGKTGTGILMICTFGGLGIWYLVDVVMIASGGFKDAKGQRVLRWDPEDQPDYGDLPQEVIEELVALRGDVSELAERLDFAERLLADPTRRTG